MVRRMISTHRAQCLYIANTRSQAEELMWAPLKDLLEKLEIAAVFNETKLRCVLRKNGSVLRLVGADDKREIEKLRGQPFHEVGIDESASYPAQLLDHLMFRVIGPRLGDYDGTIWTIGTPGHLPAGPFYDATRPGSEISRHWSERDRPEYADWHKWSKHAWSLLDGSTFVPEMARLWERALRDKAANGWSDLHPVWRREYLGQWCQDDTENVFKYRPHDEEGNPWNQWDPQRTKQGFAILPPGDWRYVIGMDMGHSDPFALEVFAYQQSAKTLWHVYEFERRGMYARTIAEILLGPDLNTDTPSGVLGVTGWPDGMVADTAGLGDALIEELSNVYGLKIEAAEKKNKFDAIELSNGDLIDGHVKVLKGSKLEEQMMSLQWAIDDVGRLKENKGQRNDCTDAFVYARRRAMHQFTVVAAPDAPLRGSPPALEQQMREDEDRAAGIGAGEFDGVLSDGEYKEEFWG